MGSAATDEEASKHTSIAATVAEKLLLMNCMTSKKLLVIGEVLKVSLRTWIETLHWERLIYAQRGVRIAEFHDNHSPFVVYITGFRTVSM